MHEVGYREATMFLAHSSIFYFGRVRVQDK